MMIPGEEPLWLADVSRETRQQLEGFWALVQKWNTRINLVSNSTVSDGWMRHVVDSAQLWPVAPVGAVKWLDIGSGGGFPGLVIAILAQELRPGLKVTLVESDQRKATFLREAVRQLGLNSLVLSERAESLAPFGADVLSARALAGIDALLGHAKRHLAPDGVALFLKGRTVQEELQAARRNWRFDCNTIPSLTDSEAAVVKIWGIRVV